MIRILKNREPITQVAISDDTLITFSSKRTQLEIHLEDLFLHLICTIFLLELASDKFRDALVIDFEIEI